jgi:hypothetical protein
MPRNGYAMHKRIATLVGIGNHTRVPTCRVWSGECAIERCRIMEQIDGEEADPARMD